MRCRELYVCLRFVLGRCHTADSSGDFEKSEEYKTESDVSRRRGIVLPPRGVRGAAGTATEVGLGGDGRDEAAGRLRATEGVSARRRETTAGIITCALSRINPGWENFQRK